MIEDPATKDVKVTKVDAHAQAVIETWFQSWFHNSPGISDNSWVYERLRSAVNNLKAQFEQQPWGSTSPKEKEEGGHENASI